MKTRAGNKIKSREGGALVMATLVLLAFSILQIGLYKLRETSVVETVFVEHHKQAFWLAESGLHDGLVLINFDKDFRDDPTPVPSIDVSAVGGSYDIGVERTLIDEDTGEYEYTITSTGTVRGVTRVLESIFSSFPGGKYAIIGINGNTELDALVEVDGAIAQIAGTLDVADSRYLDGYLIMGDGEGALTDKKGAATVANYPPPPAPVIDFADYEGAITKLSNNTNLPHSSTTNVNVSTLSGNLYYNADEVIMGGSGTTIADGTTIVSTGDIIFPKSHVVIGENVTIVARNFSIANQSEMGGGTLIYAQNDIYLRNASDTTTPGDSAIVLVARNNVTLDSQIDFRGIIFGENAVEINANGSIEGTIIGGNSVEANSNITITYDESVFKEGTPITPKVFGDVILTRISWKELPSL
jgi:hypothetical protein